jgi:superfamily II DNA or RNA helicase
MAEMVATLINIIPRNNIICGIVKQALGEGRKILILTGLRSHCFNLQNMINQSGLYIGGMKEIDLIESSKKQVIIATFQLANEGLDIPTLDTVILATPKSDIKQSIGRIMRETPGKKNDPLIIDIVDHWSIFFSMYNKRKKIYHECGFKMDEPKKPVEDKCMFI